MQYISGLLLGISFGCWMGLAYFHGAGNSPLFAFPGFITAVIAIMIVVVTEYE